MSHGAPEPIPNVGDNVGGNGHGFTIETSGSSWAVFLAAAADASLMGNLLQSTGLGNVLAADGSNTITGNTFIAPAIGDETPAGFEQFNEEDLSRDSGAASLATSVAHVFRNNTFNRGVAVYDNSGAFIRTIWADINVGIQNAAMDGSDTVEALASGTPNGIYVENVIIDRPLTLLGPNAGINGEDFRNAEAVIEPTSGVGVAVTAASGTVTVEGFKIVADVGIDSASVTFNIEDNVIDATDTGVDISRAASATVDDNLITTDGLYGVYGLSLPGSVTVDGNTINVNDPSPNDGFGVQIADSVGGAIEVNDNSIAGTIISGGSTLGYGIQINNAASSVTIDGNTITNASSEGIEIAGFAGDVQIGVAGDGNDIVSPVDQAYGIDVEGGTDAASTLSILGNTVSVYSYGINIHDVAGATVIGGTDVGDANTITPNSNDFASGIQILQDSAGGDVSIIGNSISSGVNGGGIIAHDMAGNLTIQGNTTLLGGFAGAIAVTDSSGDVQIGGLLLGQGNDISTNSGDSADGISIIASGGPISIQGNTINAEVDGINLDSDTDTVDIESNFIDGGPAALINSGTGRHSPASSPTRIRRQRSDHNCHQRHRQQRRRRRVLRQPGRPDDAQQLYRCEHGRRHCVRQQCHPCQRQPVDQRQLHRGQYDRS